MLERFTTAYAYQVAGQFANLEFWLDETVHAVEVVEGYNGRFKQLSMAQQTWIAAHDTVVGTYWPICQGRCEFEAELKRPRPPTRIPPAARNEAVRRVKDAAYYFLLRCYRMDLLDEASFRQHCQRIGTSVEASDLTSR